MVKKKWAWWDFTVKEEEDSKLSNLLSISLSLSLGEVKKKRKGEEKRELFRFKYLRRDACDPSDDMQPFLAIDRL